jgi:hypothetical protein
VRYDDIFSEGDEVLVESPQGHRHGEIGVVIEVDTGYPATYCVRFPDAAFFYYGVSELCHTGVTYKKEFVDLLRLN